MIRRTLLIILIFILNNSCSQQQKNVLYIAVSANMQFAIKEASKDFTAKTGIECELIIGSSGKLTAQIKEGAPFDIFISANMKYPEELFKTGKTVNEPKVYAYGKLVLWSAIEGVKPSIEMLKSIHIRHIALANPKMAPYGVASIEVLQNNQIYPDVEHKLVYGESILQTNQFIISESVQIGFTSKSVVLSDRMKNKGNWVEIEDKNYTPIKQSVVVIKHDHNRVKQENVEKYYQFLWSKETASILENYGYEISKD